MPEPRSEGDWLLLDAAGPASGVGLLRDGEWLDLAISEEPFLEFGSQAVERLLSRSGCSLDRCRGVLYAAGPGSTLGLRLAAMLTRTLCRIPRLSRWQCFQYNNLVAAAAGHHLGGATLPVRACAPWRRDRVHEVVLKSLQPLDFALGAGHPDEQVEADVPCFILGRRTRLPETRTILPFNLENLPAIFEAAPGILVPCETPAPYHPESMDFVRWSAERHTAP